MEAFTSRDVPHIRVNNAYRNHLREEIIKLFMQDEAQNARSYMEEYKLIAEESAELCSMKGIILIKENKLDEAETVLKRGLDFDSAAFDLLINLGTLYMFKGNKKLAADYYQQAFSVAETEALKAEVMKNIDRINQELEQINKEKNKQNPLVSIILFAYNRLDFTKQCIDSLFKYSSHIDFELIAINNGSSDGTEEYFRSLPNVKMINFPQNVGCDIATNEGLKLAEGEFTLILSNDLILTHDWLDNLLICIKSDEKIGMVVPVCSFSSNHQQIHLNYNTIEEMQQLAKEYNKSDPFKWEERIRLITYALLTRTKVIKMLGGADEAYSPGGFDDDDQSFTFRRAGYKLMLAKDTFIHHFGSVTMRDEYSVKNDLLARNRRIFFNKFGVDAWGDTWFDYEILNLIDYSKSHDVNILEIGFSCGATSLQIKNRFKENRVTDVTLWYLTEDERFLADLKTVCDHAFYGQFESIASIFEDTKFDYIIINHDHKLEALLNNSGSLLKENGRLIFLASEGQRELVNSILNPKQQLQKFLLTEVQSTNRLIFVADQKKRSKNVLLYPGYDFWLNDIYIEDNSIGNFLGVDTGKNAMGLLRDELDKTGWKLCTIDKGNMDDAEYVIFCDLPKQKNNPFYRSIFHLVCKGAEYFEECLTKKPKLKLLLLLLEAPFVMPENYDKNSHENFDIVFTYNDDLVDNVKYFKYFYSQPDNVENKYAKAFKEKNLCTLIAANKFSDACGELYSERRKAIEYYENNHPDEFDLYGSGWQHTGYKCYKGTIESKLQALSGYKFCICYENGILNGYITEKIFDCFFAGCVPIYLGAPNITDYIPDNTFIDLRKFSSYDELYSFIGNMDEEQYNGYLKNIQAFLKSDGFKKFTNEFFAKSIADAIEGLI